MARESSSKSKPLPIAQIRQTLKEQTESHSYNPIKSAGILFYSKVVKVFY